MKFKFTFSLSTIFIATAILSLILSVLVARHRDLQLQQQFNDKYRIWPIVVGGEVIGIKILGQHPSNTLIKKAIHDTPSLQSVSLVDPARVEEILPELASLPNLRYLRIIDKKLTEDSFNLILQFENLEDLSLDLEECRLEKAILMKFGRLKRLKDLSIPAGIDIDVTREILTQQLPQTRIVIDN